MILSASDTVPKGDLCFVGEQISVREYFMKFSYSLELIFGTSN